MSKEVANVRTLIQLSSYRKLRRQVENTHIDLLDEPKADRYGIITLGGWGGYLVQAYPMLFNDRLVLADATGLFYEYGWCYKKGPALFLAALVWNPDTEAEPAGYTKRIGLERQAGQRLGDAP